MKKVAIGVIINKEIPDDYERISMESLIKVFQNKYDLYIVAPKKISTKNYIKYGVKEIRLPDIWFSSYRKYSELCLQDFFYEHFLEYRFLLLYQLDGFTFYDNLEYFCDLKYDYIGAPWEYGNFWYKNQNETIWYVGCGGVSLRKVRSFIEFTKNENIIKQAPYEQEDMLIASSYDKISLAPVEVAKEFCVTEYYDDLNGELPMFLHWFNHMDNKSYRKAIQGRGYKLPPYIPYNIKWDKDAKIKSTEYWKNKFRLVDVKNALDNLAGRSIKRCYIWGAGANGIMITKMLTEIGIDVIAFIDNDSSKWNTQLMRRDVLSFDQVCDKETLILVSPSRAEDINQQLKKQEWVRNKHYILWKDFAVEAGFTKGGLR